jgi:hypothetical protein
MRFTTLMKLIAVAVVLANLVMYVHMANTGRANFGLFLAQTASTVALLAFVLLPCRRRNEEIDAMINEAWAENLRRVDPYVDPSKYPGADLSVAERAIAGYRLQLLKASQQKGSPDPHDEFNFTISSMFSFSTSDPKQD